jgi:hypothetical protein
MSFFVDQRSRKEFGRKCTPGSVAFKVVEVPPNAEGRG